MENSCFFLTLKFKHFKCSHMLEQDKRNILTLSPWNRPQCLALVCMRSVVSSTHSHYPRPGVGVTWGVSPGFCVLDAVRIVLGSAHMTEAGAVSGPAGGKLGLPCTCIQNGQCRSDGSCGLRFVDSGPRQGCTYREL